MTKEQMEEVVKLRLAGHSFSEIGRAFGKDHTTIMYHCQKAGINPGKTISRRTFIPRKYILDKNTNTMLKVPEDPSEAVNPGKDYADYVAEEKARNWKKRSDIARSALD